MDTEHIPATRMAVLPMGNGKDLILHSWTYADRQHIKRFVLDEYKREQIRTWTENVDLLPPEMRQQAVKEAFIKASEITLESLPTKTMQMPKTDDDGNEIEGEMVDANVDYVTWWLSETEDGKLFAIWLSARHDPSQKDMTREQIADLVINAAGNVEAVAQEVGRISQSELAKNSEGPGNGATTTQPVVTA